MGKTEKKDKDEFVKVNKKSIKKTKQKTKDETPEEFIEKHYKYIETGIDEFDSIPDDVFQGLDLDGIVYEYYSKN